MRCALQAQSSTVGVGADLEDATGGFEIQTAYAVGNHTAVQLNFLHAARNEEDYGSVMVIILKLQPGILNRR
jgi:hypothetical protein